MATIRWSLSRQSQLLQQGAEARILEVSNKLEVLHNDFKTIIQQQGKHLHEIDKQLLNYQTQVAETYMKKHDCQSQFRVVESKIDNISNEAKSYHKDVLSRIDRLAS
ncbi:hypothetical protein H0A36_13225 [Endozoicomonas sp. SM1973]|uniref:Uncharacterized protein n=1 Tax=Spartinivicinus marinus TaxID=2994442 RepID=A0A853IBS2_9GAMM|nr:hypothetical protein [Spartinivicinus marinus]MCX4029642.1 hypothetical protein [Spartinivicinus marinus]NYZ66977.1 hypothetical protein [Spartinivicinus marinus]